MSSGTMKRLLAESSSSSSCGGGGKEAAAAAAEPAVAVLCAPRPRRPQVRPCSADLILAGNSRKQREGKNKEEDGGWALFGGSPPARADNPLVNDPHFLLNQRRPVPDLSSSEHHGRGNHGRHLSTFSTSSFVQPYAPAPVVRIQGFDVASCRSSHSSSSSSTSGGRVLSARA